MTSTTFGAFADQETEARFQRTARTLRLLPDGSVMSARSIQKIRSGERGWRYSAALLAGAGAGAPPSGDRGRWLAASLARVTRRLVHPGCHRYAWPLRRGVQLAMTATPYPKEHEHEE